MLTAIKKLLGIRTGIKGKQIDFDNCWTVVEINNRNKLLARMIELVPTDSIWSIEGLDNKKIYDVISTHLYSDETEVWKGTVWPKQNFFKVKLTENAKEDILQALPDWDLDWNIIHQHIYKDDKFYLTSYDNLHEACTWISKELDQEELTKLKNEEILDFYDDKKEEKE